MRQVDALRDLPEFGEITIQLHAAAHAQFVAELLVALFNCCQGRFMFALERRDPQLLQPVGDLLEIEFLVRLLDGRFPPLIFRHVAEVIAGAEGTAGTGENQHPNLAIVLDHIEDAINFVEINREV
jgi:hypothetical protein